MTPRTQPAWPLYLLLTLLCLQLPVAPTAAQDSSTRERERAAKAAFDEGVAAAEAGDYARARDLFLRSRQLVVKASTLLNLAVTDLKLGLVDEALFALDALDAPTTGPEHDRMLQRAKQLRAEAETLRQAADDQKSAAHAAEVRAAAEALEDPMPRVAAPAAREDTTPIAETAPSPPPSHHGPALAGPRALLVAGGLLAGGAIGGAIWWANRSRNVEECRRDRDMVCRESAQIERQETAAMALTLTLGVSALSLVTGGAIWLVQRKHDARTTLNVSAWGVRGAGGVGVRGVF